MTAAGAVFTRNARLRSAADYRHVFAHGRKIVTDGLVVIAAPGPTDQPRLGLAMAKRRISRAVDRNRVKRVVRESFRVARAGLPVVDIVVLARSQTAGMSNRVLFDQLTVVWPRIADRLGPHADR